MGEVPRGTVGGACGWWAGRSAAYETRPQEIQQPRRYVTFGVMPNPRFHDERGKFKRGNKAAVHVRPDVLARGEYADLFAEKLSRERFSKILDKLLTAAEKGDSAAANLVVRAAAGDRPIRNEIQLGEITSIEELISAAAALADAVAQGRVEPEQVQQATNALMLVKSVMIEREMISRLESLEAKLSDGTTLGEGHSLKLALEQVEPAAVAEGQTP
ncbi:MAG: hypothetical protein AAGF47_05605 [Planctomycetota bacterium]